MDDDQQFCLRWNNHQSTLVAVFDTLLEKGTLVDCTLAAEGKYLNAHKVVLSACSPYFESLLSKHFDKHPILILKDVKFQELKAMMDYMYRGEVNISQDQLGALLKAAESLQIKGLSDNRKGETERKPAPVPPPPKSPQPTSALSKVQGLTIEQRSRDDSREGSMSPGPRKKKRLRRKSEELDNHDASNSSESHSLPAQNIPSSLPAVSKMNADVPEPVESKSEILTRHKQPEDIPQVPIIKEKLEHTELMLEPKSEYVDEMNEDSIEDLTLDDDDISNMEQMDDQAGPSHGNAGEGSSQGFGGWHMGNQSQDEVFLAAQEAVGAHRDSQDADECALPTSLPEKSKVQYEAAYSRFEKWCEENNMENVNENTLMVFFEEKAKVQKFSSLWSQYCKLRSVISMRKNIDISSYKNLLTFLKGKSVGYQAVHSKFLTKQDIETFLREADDNTYLLMKVVLIIGVAGACRNEELCYLRSEDVKDEGYYFRVTIPINPARGNREFIILSETINGLNPVEIIRKYLSLRPPQADNHRFFLAYRNDNIHSLSEKSRIKYEGAYSRFKKWCEDNNKNDIDENTIMAYFEDKAKIQKSSSLWNQYSMLRSVLLLQKNIDIKSKDLLAFLKRKSVGYRPTKYKFLSKQEIDTFLAQADDKTYLLMKVVMIIGVAGACRSIELGRMCVEDVRDEGSYFRIIIPAYETRSQREFIILAEAGARTGLNPAEIIRKYINLRPPRLTHNRFFVVYKDGRCSNLPLGVNTMGRYPKKIASYLGLPQPECYSRFCVIKSSHHGSMDTFSFTGGYRHEHY